MVEKQLAEEAKTRMLSGKKDPGSNLSQGSDKKRNPKTSQVIAGKIGVSENTYRNMKQIVTEGTPEQVARMDRGGKGNGVSAIVAEIKCEKGNNRIGDLHYANDKAVLRKPGKTTHSYRRYSVLRGIR